MSRLASTSGFVVYQHGTWTVQVSAVVERACVTDERGAGDADRRDELHDVGTRTASRLAAATSAGRAAYWPLIRDAECRHALPAGLLDAVVFQESHYSPFAVSRAGAGGLTQLMPRTATGLGVGDRFEPAANIDGGARYLRAMLDHYRSVPLAVAAYNAGRGAVDRWGGIPLNRETPGYVQKVLGFFNGIDREAFAAPVATMPGSRIVSLTFGSARSE